MDWTGLSGADGQLPGREVAGRYRLESVIGRGGMGVVWRAVDTLIERPVAIKELRALTGTSEGDESSFAERAMREARHAGRLNHPAVVGVHDVIAPAAGDDAVYIVMEYVQAPTLAAVLDQQGPLPAHRVAVMGLGILDALEAAHAMGIVHRDIKPGNVLVRDGDRVKLTDFGIALAAEDSRLTRSGVMGTHAYLAPECFDAGQVGPAADLWALGATLFHAVAGRAPFDRATTTATLRAILFEDPPTPPCEPRLAQVITGLLTRPIEQRLTSVTARQRLQPIATAPPGPTPAAGATPNPGAGRSAWEAQATSFHRQPPGTPPPRPVAAQPGGQPSPYVTTPPAPPARPAAPASYQGGPPGPPSPPRPYAGGASGRPPQAPPPTGPAHGPHWAGQPQPQPRSSKTQWIVAGALTAVAALVLVVVVVSRSKGGGSDGPEGAVERLLEASKNQDLAAAQGALCQDDLSSGFFTDELSSVQIVSYTIENVEEDGDVSLVHVSMETTDDSVDDSEIPVVQEDGSWKVCFARLIDDLDVPDTDLTVPDSLRRPQA